MDRIGRATEFRTFDETVEVLTLDTPHALVLEWWRRLERAIDYYFKIRGLPRRHSADAEHAIGADPQLGPAVAAQVRELRRTRNAIAHEETRLLPREDATSFAAACLDLVWRIAAYPADQAAGPDPGRHAV
jgi:hypothetical protein